MKSIFYATESESSSEKSENSEMTGEEFEMKSTVTELTGEVLVMRSEKDAKIKVYKKKDSESRNLTCERFRMTVENLREMNENFRETGSVH